MSSSFAALPPRIDWRRVYCLLQQRRDDHSGEIPTATSQRMGLLESTGSRITRDIVLPSCAHRSNKSRSYTRKFRRCICPATCRDEPAHAFQCRRLSDDVARPRSVAFFNIWYRQVMHCLQPERIVITDSASPVKPDYLSYPAVHWIELDRNYGHPNDLRTGRIRTRYSGYTRAVINGAMYALCCDADFYVYVEQDCVLYGEDFLTHAVGNATEDILMGRVTEQGRGLGGRAAAAMPQQSLVVVRGAALPRFIEGIVNAPCTDGELSPELIMHDRLAPVGFLRVPYGRSRPIDFERGHFYVQHLDEDELRRFLSLIRLRMCDREFVFRR